MNFGWLPNEYDSRDYLFADLRLHLTSTNRVSLFKYAHVRNQRNIPSCVGEAVAGAAGITQTIKSGIDYKFSSLWPYWYARFLQGNHRKLVGTSIRQACRAITRLGLPEEKHWPFSTSPITVRRQPSPGATMNAHGRAGGQYTHIFDEDEDKLVAIRTALAAGYPVIFGTLVDDLFLNANGSSIVTKPKGRITGGHAMIFTGFCTSNEQGPLFEVLNSWGTNWRSGGRCWFTADYVLWDQVRDLTIMYGWKDIRRVK